MIYHAITTRSGWRLSQEPNNLEWGSRVILVKEGKDDFDLWSVTLHESSEWNVGILLVNKASGMIAVPSSINDNETVVMVPVNKEPGNISTHYAWQTNSKAGDPNNVRSIMALTNEDLALYCGEMKPGPPWDWTRFDLRNPLPPPPTNIRYARVHDWEGGTDDEVWVFQQVLL